MSILVTGTQAHVVEVAQQLVWLTAVFRVPQYGEVTTSDAVLEHMSNKTFNIYLQDLQKIDEDPEVSCWLSLFKNTVLAHWFLTPRRGQEKGVELSFEVMVTLSNVSYPLALYDGIILKGPFTALIPTTHLSGSIQWHFMSNNIGKGRLGTDVIAKRIPEFFETHDIDLLRNARTFLGYCRKVNIHLGTHDANYRNIQKSDADREPSTIRVDRETSAALGTGGMGIFSAMLGTKVTYSKGLQATTASLDLSFRSKLLRSRDELSLLWDTETNTGWLASELSVVLHLAHVRALNDPGYQIGEQNKIPFARLSGDGGLAAWNAIAKGTRMNSTIDSIEGNPDLGVIKDLIAVLESRKELAIKRETSFSNPFKKSSLQGWEFVDVAALKFMCSRKEVPLIEIPAGTGIKS